MLVVVVVEVGCRLSGDRTGPYQSGDVVVVHCSAHLAFLLYEDGGVQITFIFSLRARWQQVRLCVLHHHNHHQRYTVYLRPEEGRAKTLKTFPHG